MARTYDAIVIGARCGGSLTALLLARMGYEVLLVDKATFPSDTLSTHLIHPDGVARLHRWGLLDEIRGTGAPAIERYSVDFGPFRIRGAPRPTTDGIAQAYGARRLLVDHLLIRAAGNAGAEIREGFDVQEVSIEDGVAKVRGSSGRDKEVTETARVVIGADGRHSQVARAVDAETYHERPTLAATYFAYWSGVSVDGLEIYVRPERSFGAFSTNDGLTLVVMSWPLAEFKANRHDIEGNFLKSLELAPDLAARVGSGARETRFLGTGEAPGFYRKPFGPGWALVGDARHHKDPCTAKGMSEAFHDAELVAEALDSVWSGSARYGDALGGYQRRRDEETLPMYEFTCQLASLQPPPPEMAQLLAATSTNARASSDFVSVLAGTLPLPAFLDPENVAKIMQASPAAAG